MADGTNIDILSAPPPGPATSATSDTPPPPAPPPPHPGTDNAAPPQANGQEAETGTTATEGGEGEIGEAGAPAASQPQQSRFGQRLSELTAARRAAEEARAAADARVDKLTQLVEKLTAAQQQPAAPTEPVVPKPQRDQFADPDAYDEALVSWATSKAATAAAQRTAEELDRRQKEQRDTEETARQRQAEQQHFESLRNGYAEKRAKLLEDPAYADFELIAEAETLPVTETMIGPLLIADNGPQVLYHLGKNPAEATRIAALNPLQQAVEIGKISARLALPERPQPSRLPRPMAPVGGNNGATPRALDELSTEEYAAQRLPQLRAERRAGMWGQVKPS
jgi:hypothetical protein